MPHFTITQLKKNTGDAACTATIDVQIQKIASKTTKTNKPYLQVDFADASDQFTLKIWENLPQFETIPILGVNAIIRLEGDWTQSQYGIEGVRWQLRPLNKGEIASFLSGDPEIQQRQAKDWHDIETLIDQISDPRLKYLCEHFIDVHGDHFKRTAAAKKNHHARRGGLVEHVAQMMRCAEAIGTVYPKLNTDLMLTGILFHDCGKLWENSYGVADFTQTIDLEGELLGHIPLGINFVDRLWNEIITPDSGEQWSDLTPSNELVRLHLLHLIASHHGTHEFGSPTLPRTPEAHALHHIDNLDAKYEMLTQAYQVSNELAPGIYEKQFPMRHNLVEPLQHFPTQPTAQSATVKKAVAKKAEDTTPVKAAEPSDIPHAENELESQPFNGDLF